MKLKAIRIYPQLFILILLLRNSVSAQIDWAEDEDDPGKHLQNNLLTKCERKWHITQSEYFSDSWQQVHSIATYLFPHKPIVMYIKLTHS